MRATEDSYTVSEAKLLMYNNGLALGKKDGAAARPEWQDGDRLRNQADRMAATLIDHWGIPEARRQEMADALMNGYQDGWRGKRAHVARDAAGSYYAIRHDGSIAQTGSPDSLHAFAQREGYCIWTFNAQGGNLVCAYNPNSPSAPDYPNKQTVNTMRAGTKWAADSSSRSARLHRALDCIMDRVGYGRAKDAEGDLEFLKQNDIPVSAGCIIVSGRWWPIDSTVAQNFIREYKQYHQERAGGVKDSAMDSYHPPRSLKYKGREYSYTGKEGTHLREDKYGKQGVLAYEYERLDSEGHRDGNRVWLYENGNIQEDSARTSDSKETPTKFAVRKGGGAYPSFFNTYNEALEYQKERGGTIWSIGAPDYKWKQVTPRGDARDAVLRSLADQMLRAGHSADDIAKVVEAGAKDAEDGIPSDVKIGSLETAGNPPKTYALVETPEFRQRMFVSGYVKNAQEFYDIASYTINRMRKEM